VGFELYLKLLEEAVQRLSDDTYQDEIEVLLELEYTGFIPDTYITSPQIKMEIYKKLASLISESDIALMHSELLDRFGPVPKELSSLLALADIRRLCKNLHILTLKERTGLVRVEFGQLATVSVDKVLRLIADSNGTVRLDSKHPNHLLIATADIGLEEKAAYLRKMLEALD
jgi:transcription-repair coupling factor (superfamily II helicase)